MTHYKAKVYAEQELQDVFTQAEWQSGIGVSDQTVITSAKKPFYYNIEASASADTASINGATLFCIYRNVASQGVPSDNTQDFVQMSYTLTFFMSSIDEQSQDVIDNYMDDLLEKLQASGWQCAYSQEDKLTLENDKKLLQLVYQIDKLLTERKGV